MDVSNILNGVPPPIYFELPRDDTALLTDSIFLTVIILLSAIVIIRCSFNYRKNSLYFKKFKKYSINGVLLIIISTFSWIIIMEEYYIYHGANHWLGIGLGHYIPHFGVIGPFIGSALIVAGVLLEEKTERV
jgi:hypothetical protein